MTFALTDRQRLAWDILGGPASHAMVYGGSRSGKTFLIMRAVLMRALAHKSRHAVLRFRFNHVVTSIVHDTLPKVCELCWPGLDDRCKLDKSLWFYQLPNGSEIWFGGLDEKERTEKILGQEYASIFLNECSQIPFGSRNMAMTRLAQNTPLRLKAFYDCNPPGRSHWTYKLFIERMDPDRHSKLAHPGDYAAISVNPADNQANLPGGYLRQLESLPQRQRQRFLLGEFASETESALWTPELLDKGRVIDGKLPELQRVMIAVDPSGCAGPEDTRSDEVGIIVVGLGTDQRGYVLEDLSGRHGPREWGNLVALAYDRWRADAVVAEANFGGAMVAEIIRSARPGTPFREVNASRGKVIRAEPVAVLFEQGKASMVGYFPTLEDQLCIAKGTLVETASGQVPIEDIRAGDLVLTRNGLAPVKCCGITGYSSSMVIVCTPKSTLEVTPCHPIFVRGKFVSASSVKNGDHLLVSRNWVSMDRGIPECPTAISAMRRVNSCIAQSMRRMWDRYQMGFISITRTVIQAITDLTTWSVFVPESMSSAMSLAGLETLHLKSGLNTQRPRGLLASHGNSPALSVVPRGRQPNHTSGFTVPTSVGGAWSIDGIKPAPVYNLEVEQGYLPEYFANGILVHNCGMTTAGYIGDRSPDRADAMVWGLAELFPAMTRKPRSGPLRIENVANYSPFSRTYG